MKVLGITGGIGSGKSVISKIFNTLGYPVYDTDNKAKNLVNTDLILQKKIINLLGNKSYINGKYNRSFVAQKVFSDNNLLQKLNDIIHPAVHRDFEKWKNNQSTTFVGKESAILFQTGAYKDADYKLIVSATTQTRITRIQKRDPNRTKEQIFAIIEKQGDWEEFYTLTDFIITNNKSDSLISEVKKIINIIA